MPARVSSASTSRRARVCHHAARHASAPRVESTITTPYPLFTFRCRSIILNITFTRSIHAHATPAPRPIEPDDAPPRASDITHRRMNTSSCHAHAAATRRPDVDAMMIPYSPRVAAAGPTVYHRFVTRICRVEAAHAANRVPRCLSTRAHPRMRRHETTSAHHVADATHYISIPFRAHHTRLLMSLPFYRAALPTRRAARRAQRRASTPRHDAHDAGQRRRQPAQRTRGTTRREIPRLTARRATNDDAGQECCVRKTACLIKHRTCADARPLVHATTTPAHRNTFTNHPFHQLVFFQLHHFFPQSTTPPNVPTQ